MRSSRTLSLGWIWQGFLTLLVLVFGVPMLASEQGLGKALLIGFFVVAFIWVLGLVLKVTIDRAISREVSRQVKEYRERRPHWPK